jgi:DNA-directed RNA polymerase specialized sigma24 family protein
MAVAPARSDAALVARIRDRDRAAWEEIYRRFADRLHGFACLLTGDPDDAADLVQETFVRALPYLDGLDPDSVDLGAYLIATEKNLFLKSGGGAHRAEQLESMPEPGMVDDGAPPVGMREPSPPIEPIAPDLFERVNDALEAGGFWRPRRRKLLGRAVPRRRRYWIAAAVVVGVALLAAVASAYLGTRASKPTVAKASTEGGAPRLVVPVHPLTRVATGPAGTRVTYSVTANVDVDLAITPSCSPASGALFPLGTTRVVCTAEDLDENRSHASFIVKTVDTAAPALDLPAPRPVEG